MDRALGCSPLPSLLYHYTSQEGLLGIIKSKSLWASSAFHLNDATEFLYTIDLAENILEAAIAEYPNRKFYRRLLPDLERAFAFVKHVFVVSFSENPDLLSQWRAYTGGGAGFSVGFDTSNLLTLAERQRFHLVQCIYDPLIQRRILKKTLQRAYEYSLQTHQYEAGWLQYCLRVVALASIFKHPSFGEEKEWRIVSEFMENYWYKWRPGKSMIIPYTDFRLATTRSAMAIRIVYVGPTPHLRLAARSLYYLLTSSQISGGTEVRTSDIPYRNW
jgi:hypothetical protein